MAGLPREVIRWLQSLDLTWQVKNAKWDLANGYLVAEIFSWYYPQAIQMHNYYTNGTSLKTKQLNWDLLNTFFKKHNIDIPPDLAEATMHAKEGAAMLLIERMYELLTNRQLMSLFKLGIDRHGKPQTHEGFITHHDLLVKKKEGFEIDFTDRAYQARLPMHARTTASQAVKNNIRLTELDAQPSTLHTQYKAHDVIRNHVEQRRLERFQHPERFDIKPSVAEQAVRKHPPQSTAYDDSTDMRVSQARASLSRSVPGTGQKKKSSLKAKTPATKQETRQLTSGGEAVVKEVSVKQMNTPMNYSVSVGGS